MKDRNFLFGKKSMENYQGLQRQDGRGNKTNLGKCWEPIVLPTMNEEFMTTIKRRRSVTL